MDGQALRRLGGSSSFLPFASARSDGVVRAPVSAACVWALRTPLETLTTRWSPRACASDDAGAAHMCDGSHFWPFMARISRKRPLPDIDPNPSMLYSNRANIYLPRHLTTIFEIKIKESKGFQVHKDSQQSKA